MTEGGDPVWRHIPVMAEQSVELLRLSRGVQILEGNVGLGGHTKLILEKLGIEGHLWGFELDPRVADEAEKRLSAFKGAYTIFRANFRDFDLHLKPAGVKKLLAAFFDLGIGWYNLGPMFGMAIKIDLPIDFRFSPTMDIPSGAEIIDEADLGELARIISAAGERRFAGRIGRAIIDARPIVTTGKLARVIEDAVPRKFQKPGVSPAQRIFAHLRSIVNDEVGALDEAMSKLTNWIEPGGRVVFLAYSSDELSRIRKYIKGTSCECPPNAPVCQCGKDYRYKVLADGIRPDDAEIESNISARSARLIAGELIYGPSGVRTGE